MTCTYRGVVYEIEKPVGMCKGEMWVNLDGEELAGNVVPLQGDGTRYRVKLVVYRISGKG
jgi:hypothetical protein